MVETKTLEVPGYQVMEYLGSGARSTIWCIRDRRTGSLYALKRVVKRTSADQRFIDQAENEYEIASQMNHPNIRSMSGVRRIRRLLRLRELHLIMEYCTGQSIQQNRPTEPIKALEIFIEVAGGLDFMHRSGFIHADTKPNNIIVDSNGSVKIIDLGQSCRTGTVKQRIQGTPDFIAPEQVYRKPLNPRTDVFNFGATLYWTLAGRPINTVIPKNSQAIQLRNELSLTPLSEINPAVPQALSTLVADCVEFQPNQRPESIQAVRGRLDMILTQMRRNGRKTDTPPADQTE